MTADMDQVINLRSKCKYFRVLVIGRANAGKTTLLKKVCKSIANPEIFSPGDPFYCCRGISRGSEFSIPQSFLLSIIQRGLHNIENQLIFKSNPQFIFHDSRGFESGSVYETDKVKTFITKRAESTSLSEQLHAIWYCLPPDTDRPLLKADEDFFNTYGTDKVPVIAIFTKFDGLVTEAYTDLLDDGSSKKEARNGAVKRAEELLETSFRKPLSEMRFPPSDYVRLDDMRKDTNNCNDLIATTAKALNDDTLRLLFVSVQQNNFDVCIEYAVEVGVEARDLKGMVRDMLACFPHVWVTSSHDALVDPLLSFALHHSEGRGCQYQLCEV
ncbi:GTP-binding protein [Mycena venus]|uniref:GTP-binding protein n=1 Tax=Mycena venus TaxID=2733690 RepID=A0A8H6XT41_9AGAR|nr:GTP-binding protein [Mycena venus]